jgi:hypothetical protein
VADVRPAPKRLSPADMKAVWAALEDMTDDLGPIVAWLPSGVLKDSLEGALGKLTSAQWKLVRDLGADDGDSRALTGEPNGQDGWPGVT